jgi:hypothetical protein
MVGIVGVFLVVAAAIALVIAGVMGRKEPASSGRFVLRFVVALVVVLVIEALLVFGACALIFGRMFPGGGCINC